MIGNEKESRCKSVNNILLIVVLLYLIACIWNGYRKGLVKMIFSVVSLFIAIIITRMVAPQMEDYLQKETNIYEQIQEKTEAYVEITLQEKLSTGLFSVSDQAYAIEGLPLPKYIRSVLTKNNTAEIYEILGVDAFQDYISSSLAGFTVTALAFVLSFLIIGLGIFLIRKLIERIVKLPGLNGINRLAGAAVGFLKALIILWILCLIVTAAAGTAAGQQILKMIEDSQILSMIYNHNYFMQWVTEIIEHF